MTSLWVRPIERCHQRTKIYLSGLKAQLTYLSIATLILNRDALWNYPCRVKSAIYKPLSLEEYTIQENCSERFLSYNGDVSINFLSILCHQFACMAL